jgi:SNF2 family DNA or RNA helicase
MSVEGISEYKYINPSFKLLPHQEDCLNWIKNRENNKQLGIRGGLIAVSPGLGKTLISLTTIAIDYQQIPEIIKIKPNTPSLVLSPKTALITWAEEIKKFFGDSLKVFVFRPEENNIDEITKDELNEYDIVLTNYDYVRSIVKKLNIVDRLQIEDSDEPGSKKKKVIKYVTEPLKHSKKGEGVLFSIKFHRIIADESHNFSNDKTSLFKAMMCLCGENKLCLSGTMIRNYDNDLFSQFKFIGWEKPIFNLNVYTTYKLHNFIKYMDYEIAKIKLPDCHNHIIKCKLEGKQKTIYDYYINSAREAYEEFVLGCKQFSQVLTLFLRLRQVCIAPYTVTFESSRNFNKMNEEEKENYIISQQQLNNLTSGMSTWLKDINSESGLNSIKIKKTLEIIYSIPEREKIIIFTSFTRVIDLLIQAMEISNKEGFPEKSYLHIDGSVTGNNRYNAIDAFKNASVNVLFLSYKVGSESLNLTEANHIILLEPYWTDAVKTQSIKRAHRMGCTKDVHIYEMVCPDTIEERVIEIAKGKKELADKFLKNEGQPGQKISSGINAQELAQILF